MHLKQLEKLWNLPKSEAPFWKREATDKGFRWVEPESQTSEKINEA